VCVRVCVCVRVRVCVCVCDNDRLLAHINVEPEPALILIHYLYFPQHTHTHTHTPAALTAPAGPRPPGAAVRRPSVPGEQNEPLHSNQDVPRGKKGLLGNASFKCLRRVYTASDSVNPDTAQCS